MTDLEKFLELYRSVGIEPEINEVKNGTLLRLEAESSRNSPFVGYMGFYTQITFDQNGKFQNQGIWE